MKLSAARLCLNCDYLHTERICPKCDAANWVHIEPWLNRDRTSPEWIDYVIAQQNLEMR